MEVDALKSVTAAADTKQQQQPSADKSQTDSTDHVVYQLRYRPEDAKFSSTARVSVSLDHAYVDIVFIL